MTVTFIIQPAIPKPIWQAVVHDLCTALRARLRSGGNWCDDSGQPETELTLQIPHGCTVQHILQHSHATLAAHGMSKATIRLETSTLQFSWVA